jgi:hypothetical protein
MQLQNEKFDVGGKRGRVPTSADPYLVDEALPGIQICRECHAVYQNRSWTLDQQTYQLALQQDHHLITCPACLKVDQHYAEGVVTLKGDYLWEHEEQIRNLIRNEEQRALQKNPLERILRQEREGDCLIIETTDVKLAEHIGRALHKAHRGELHFSWEGNPVTGRIFWQRQL